MPDPNPTVGELFKAKAVTDEQVNAATDAYLVDRTTRAYPITDGYSLDLAAAVSEHPWVALVPARATAGRGAGGWSCDSLRLDLITISSDPHSGAHHDVQCFSIQEAGCLAC